MIGGCPDGIDLRAQPAIVHGRAATRSGQTVDARRQAAGGWLQVMATAKATAAGSGDRPGHRFAPAALYRA
jgi:hypothetical protein